MTSFLDVIRPLTEQLENLSNKAKSAVGKYNSDTSTFQRYVTDNINGATGTVQFLGQGADACIAAVGRNVNRSQHVVTKLGDFQLACQQTKEDLEEMSRPFDQESVYRLATSDMYGIVDDSTGDSNDTTISEFFRQGQGYSPYDTTDLSTTVIWRIREDTLPGLSWQLDTLLTPGKGQQTLEDDVEYAFQCIDGDFKSHLAQKHDELDYAHSHGMDDEAYKYYSSHADGMYHLAIHYVRVIADKMKKGYAEWVTELQAMVGQFQLDLAAAAAINDPSLGNLISQINSGPNADAKVLVWQTPNGLIVVIKDGADPAAVEAALKAQYGNMPITLIGYKGGSEAAQQIVLDQEHDPGLHVTNLVVIGAPLKDTLPDGINYFSYQTQPEPKEEDEGKILGLKPDQIIIPLAAVAIGIFTDGLGELPLVLGAAKDVGTEYILAEGWNAAEEWNKAHPGEPMPTGNSSPVYIDTGNGNIHQATPMELTALADGKYPQGKLYFKESYVVPNEAGSNQGDFTNSSYLNSQLVPDPNVSKSPHGGVLPVGG